MISNVQWCPSSLLPVRHLISDCHAWILDLMGARGNVAVEALCYKPEGRE
jgi:hypothetical protein